MTHGTLFSLIILFSVLLTEGARAALTLGGAMLGSHLFRVLPSKTAILPVNPKFLPHVCTENFPPYSIRMVKLQHFSSAIPSVF